MKQGKIVQAYKLMEELAPNKELNEQEQWDLYQLRKNLKKHWEFQEEREEALRSKYVEFVDDKGMVTGEIANAFTRELNTLGDMDIELESFDKPKIRFVKGIPFTTAEALEDFIEFVKS